MTRCISAVGLLVMVAIGYVLSSSRRSIRWRPVLWGLALQVVFALAILKTAVGHRLFDAAGQAFLKLLEFPRHGTAFLFGPLLDTDLFPSPIVALSMLPTVIFFSSLISILYHLGIMQKLIAAMAWVMRRTMGTSGSESLGAASNVFVGPVEAALAVRPYVAEMTTSELMALMTTGMATVAGTVMVIYMDFVRAVGVNPAHILSASVMSAPAALAIAKLMIPETRPVDSSPAEPAQIHHANLIDAAARGAAFGLKLALSIAAMLIAFISLVALVNALLTWAGALVRIEGLTLQRLFGYLFWPFAWVMGVPADDCSEVGSLLGTKTILNEFIAYTELATKQAILSKRSLIIASYALCGFANPGTIAIAIAGLGGIAPQRTGEIARLGVKSLIGGTLAAFMTATIAGMMI